MTINDWAIVGIVASYTVVAGLQGWRYAGLARRVKMLEQRADERRAFNSFLVNRSARGSLN